MVYLNFAIYQRIAITDAHMLKLYDTTVGQSINTFKQLSRRPSFLAFLITKKIHNTNFEIMKYRQHITHVGALSDECIFINSWLGYKAKRKIYILAGKEAKTQQSLSSYFCILSYWLISQDYCLAYYNIIEIIIS